MKAFHEQGEGPLTSAMLQDEMRSRGYLLLRGVLPQDAVKSVLADVTRVLSDADWLAAVIVEGAEYKPACSQDEMVKPGSNASVQLLVGPDLLADVSP